MSSNIISNFINNQLYSSILISALFTLHCLNLLFEILYTNKKSEISTKSKDFNNVIFLSVLIILVLSLFLNIPLIRVFFQIINSLYLAHIFIINPLFNNKLTFNYKKENGLISAILFMQITYFLKSFKIETISLILKNTILVQIAVILITLIIIYLIIYMILINISFIIFYLDKLWFNNLYLKTKTLANSINKKYNFKNFDEKLSKDYKWSEVISFLRLVLKIIIAIFMNFIISTPIIILNIFLKSINEKYNNISEDNIYSISKITLVITLIVVYAIIEMSSDFSNSIISIYELISSSILIPLIIEKLIKVKANKAT